MGRRINRGRHTITVSVYDRIAAKSVSFTVFAQIGDFLAVVDRVHDAATASWSTTRLNDRRHKRR
jgi:hypothetical protein